MFGKNDISTLNSLIATTLDSVDGYRKAADAADSHRFAGMFRARADEREAVVRNLQAKVGAQGGNPEDDGTILAAAHRAFLSLRDAITGNDDTAIVAEVERGEDVIKAKYEAAMKDTDLSADTQAIIAEAYTSVRAGHDEMRDLKHQLQA